MTAVSTSIAATTVAATAAASSAAAVAAVGETRPILQGRGARVSGLYFILFSFYIFSF